MKAFFIFKDGELVGNPIGYTTIQGAKNSLVGSEDWHNLLRPYELKRGELTEEEQKSGIWRQSMFGEGWLFSRDGWCRKVWSPYVKEHYKFIEKEFDIVFKEDKVS